MTLRCNNCEFLCGRAGGEDELTSHMELDAEAVDGK